MFCPCIPSGFEVSKKNQTMPSSNSMQRGNLDARAKSDSSNGKPLTRTYSPNDGLPIN